MRIPVIYQDNTEDSVPGILLEQLLSSKKVKLFYRFSEGWVKVGTGAMRGRGGYYSGPERRSRTEDTKAGRDTGGWRRSRELGQRHGHPREVVKKRTSDLRAEIGRRRKTEEALRQSELRFRNLVETTNDLIWETDEHLVFSYVSPAIEKLLGVGQNDYIGNTLFDLMPAEEADKVRNILQSAVAEQIPFSSLEHIASHKSGRFLTLECSGVPIFNSEGKFAGYRGISRDITGRKKFDDEYLTRKKLESVGVLAGGIAHDFNNLLQVILGNICLAKGLSRSDGRIVGLLEQAETAARRASDITKRLITFSMGGTPVRETVSVAKLIKDAALFTLSGSNVKCELAIAEDLWQVEADAGQIEQVINNIVRNAQEAMLGGGILSICVENIVSDSERGPSLVADRYIRISINDNGIGIPEENIPRLFDPYFTTKEMGARKGEGLGLSICHSVVKKHQGTIHVESQVGVGSTFFIYLPASPGRGRVREGASGEVQSGGGRALVMDDKESVRRISAAFLVRMGYEVEFAGDGEEAIRLYMRASERGAPFDVVILDLTVAGGMGAKEAVKKIMEFDPGAKVIVSSGYRNDLIMTEFHRYGFKGAIAKPYSITKLAETVYAVKHGKGQ